jgi:hypothetical protein
MELMDAIGRFQENPGPGVYHVASAWRIYSSVIATVSKWAYNLGTYSFRPSDIPGCVANTVQVLLHAGRDINRKLPLVEWI